MCAGAEPHSRVETACERRGVGVVGAVERGGVALVEGQRVASVPAADVCEFGGDLAYRIVPVDRREVADLRTAGIATRERTVEAVGVVVDLEKVHTLVAGKPLVDRVVLVGLQSDDLAVPDVGEQAAARFAEAAERVDLACRHRQPVVVRCDAARASSR